jgi:uncharacterized protein YceH (UPF0502 family)
VEITAEEGRVLGCLVEKQLTTPQLYPLTENALLAACNQSTARDPVVSYDVATVRLAVRGLRDKELVRTVHRAGERSDKHLHRLEEALDLSPEQVALLAVLLLRGPQTPGELRARTERMHAFDSLEDVARVLDSMAERDEPLVSPLERQAGRKEIRYADLLVGTGARPLPSAAEPERAEHAPSFDDLVAEVAALRAEVAALRARVDGSAR